MTTKITGGVELQEIVRSSGDILRHIERQSKPPSDFMIGMEYERLGVYRDTGRAIPYDPAIENILQVLSERDGWTRGYENGRIIYLERETAAAGLEMITLEPGGQTEYSSAPSKTISGLMAGSKKAIKALDDVAAEQGITFLGIGYHPFASSADIPWVPKGRYGIMAPYLEKRGKLAHKMMKMTAGVQISIDFFDMVDAMRKLRAALLCTPVAQALFASSGIARGADIPFVTWRSRIWTATDNERCNIPEFMMREGATVEEYVDWLLDMPLMFIEEKGEYRDAQGATLRSRMKNEDVRIYDVESAMTQAFPEARLKRYVEVRSLDSVQPYLLGTAPCFWTSLLYGDLDGVFALLGGLDSKQMEEMRHAAFVSGLKGRACGRELAEWARDLLSIANVTATCHENLGHLWERVESKETPAERARKLLAECGHSSPARHFVERWNEY